jgi:hypothetical protein
MFTKLSAPWDGLYQFIFLGKVAFGDITKQADYVSFTLQVPMCNWIYGYDSYRQPFNSLKCMDSSTIAGTETAGFEEGDWIIDNESGDTGLYFTNYSTVPLTLGPVHTQICYLGDFGDKIGLDAPED